MERFKQSLVMALICSFASIWILAMPAQAQAFRLDVEVRDGIYRALDGLGSFSMPVGLEDVDIEELEIGEPIPVYVVTEDGLVRQGEEWPLYYNGFIRLTAVEIPTGFQLYAYVADAIRESGFDEVALIYDDDSFRLFDGESLYEVTKYLHVDEREPLDSVSFATLQGTCITATIDGAQSLGYIAPSQTDSNTPSNGVVTDDVGYVRQMYDKYGNYTGGTHLCWAATCASIYNYVHGTNYDVIDVRDHYNDYYTATLGNDGLYPPEIAQFINDCGNMGTYTVYTTLSESAVYGNLFYDRPLVGMFAHQGDYFGHAVTMYGININTDIVQIIDPMLGWVDASYTSTSISYRSSNGLYYYGFANIRRW